MAERATSEAPPSASERPQEQQEQGQGSRLGRDSQGPLQAGFVLGGPITENPSVAFCEDGDLQMRLGPVTITMQPQYALWLYSALHGALAEAQEARPDAFPEPDDEGGGV